MPERQHGPYGKCSLLRGSADKRITGTCPNRRHLANGMHAGCWLERWGLLSAIERWVISGQPLLDDKAGRCLEELSHMTHGLPHIAAMTEK